MHATVWQILGFPSSWNFLPWLFQTILHAFWSFVTVFLWVSYQQKEQSFSPIMPQIQWAASKQGCFLHRFSEKHYFLIFLWLPKPQRFSLTFPARLFHNFTKMFFLTWKGVLEFQLVQKRWEPCWTKCVFFLFFICLGLLILFLFFYFYFFAYTLGLLNLMKRGIRPAYLTADAEQEEHEKEECRPHRRQWHHTQGTWIHDKRQARTCKKHTHPKMIANVSKTSDDIHLWMRRHSHCQLTRVDDLVDFNARLVGHEANDGENSKASVQRREETHDVDHYGVSAYNRNACQHWTRMCTTEHMPRAHVCVCGGVRGEGFTHAFIHVCASKK